MAERNCNGSPMGYDPGANVPWCGKPATHVCTDAHDLQWFACPEHAKAPRIVATTPLDEWLRAVHAVELLGG